MEIIGTYGGTIVDRVLQEVKLMNSPGTKENCVVDDMSKLLHER